MLSHEASSSQAPFANSGNRDRPPGSTGAGAVAAAGPAQPVLRLVTPRQAAWLLVGGQAPQSAADHALVAHLLAAEPGLKDLQALACAFRDLLRRREAEALPAWLKAATASAFVELHGLAGGVRRDLAAVTAALTWQWSNGQTEGQVNRLNSVSSDGFAGISADLVAAGVRGADGRSSMAVGNGRGRTTTGRAVWTRRLTVFGGSCTRRWQRFPPRAPSCSGSASSRGNPRPSPPTPGTSTAS